jgi:hypothetical protein
MKLSSSKLSTEQVKASQIYNRMLLRVAEMEDANTKLQEDHEMVACDIIIGDGGHGQNDRGASTISL